MVDKVTSEIETEPTGTVKGKVDNFSWTDPETKKEYKFILAYPGRRKVVQMFDSARMSNGQMSQEVLWDAYLDQVVKRPAGEKLTIDSFDELPAPLFNVLMDHIDTFLTGFAG